MTAYKLIDLSEFNTVDFKKLTDSKEIDFIMLRGGFGKNNIDAKFKDFAANCVKYDIPFGVYWFSYAYTVQMARNEAQYLLNLVKGYEIRLPLAFDFENASKNFALKNGIKITKTLLSDMMCAFGNEIEKAGYYCALYANSDYLKNYYTPYVAGRYALWYANYVDNANVLIPPKTCAIWQYNSTGGVTGSVGNTDLNACYVNYPKLIMSIERAGKVIKEKTGISDMAITYIKNFDKDIILKLGKALY